MYFKLSAVSKYYKNYLFILTLKQTDCHLVLSLLFYSFIFKTCQQHTSHPQHMIQIIYRKYAFFCN